MTNLTTTADADRKRKLLLLVGGAAVALAIIVVLVYWFVFRDTSAASVDTADAEAARQQALAEAQQQEERAAAEPEPEPDSEPAAAEPEGIAGTWTIDTTIGTFDEVCLTDVCDTTFVGFRIDEELASIGAKTVVGRTPGVSGTLTIDGSTITSTDILVDMTGLITDNPSRTNAIRRQAIETNTFPEAGFTLTSPIELGDVPADGTNIEIEATGDLTIHGVTRSETIPLTAQLQGDVIVVFGQLGPILLADYEIPKPSAAVVLSVEDNATMELQLFFTR